MSLIEEAALRLQTLQQTGLLDALPVEREPRRATVRSPGTVARGAGEREADPHARGPVPLDFAHLAAQGLLTPGRERSTLGEEMRALKRPLLDDIRAASAAGQRRNLVMVTSAVPREGKSFIAASLAMSIAMEVDGSALLVDADPMGAAIPRMLGIPGDGPGLLDALVDPRLRAEDLILPTNVPHLSVLTAGATHERAAELFASERMHRLADEMAASDPERVVVFDTPPLLAATEARSLASSVGQVLLVVAADRTTQEQVKQAAAALEQCPRVLLLLNKTPRSSIGGYYPAQSGGARRGG